MLHIRTQSSIYRIIISISLLLLISISVSIVFSLPTDNLIELDENINEITEKEAEIFKELLIKTNEIEILKNEENNLKVEIEILNDKINLLEIDILKNTEIYNTKLILYNNFLKIQQKKGVFSYLDSILRSENLKIFINRINLYKNINNKSQILLKEIKKTKETLISNKSSLEKNNIELEKQRNLLLIAITKSESAISNLEIDLAALAEKRIFFESQLSQIKNDWDASIIILKDLSMFFENLFTSNDNLSEDLISMSYGLFESKAIITEEVFNNIIEENFESKSVFFNIDVNLITISFPNNLLSFTGNFIKEDDKTIIFKADEATFKGLLLGEDDFSSMFNDITFKLSLEDLLGKATIKTVESKKDFVEIIIKNNLW